MSYIKLCLSFVFFTQIACTQTILTEMKMPESKSELFQWEKGLEAEDREHKVVLEKYIETRMGNVEANRIYANGAFYQIVLGDDEEIFEEDQTWEKIGLISKEGLERMQRISKHSLMKYLRKVDKEASDNPLEEIEWYFYFDEPIYAKSQNRQFARNPKFVRKMDKTLERFFISPL